MKQKSILYQCSVCLESYGSEQEAVACVNQPADWQGWNVGDLIIIPGKRFGREPKDPQWTMDEKWVAFKEDADPKSSSHFDHCDNYHAWWLIVSLHFRPKSHETRVSVMTEIFYPEVRQGWNPADGNGHYTLFLPGVLEVNQLPHASTWWEAVGESVYYAEPSREMLQRAKEITETALMEDMTVSYLL